MKSIIIVVTVIFVVFGVMLALSIKDTGEQGVCTQTLEVCLNNCDKDNFLKGSYCVVRCALTNTACLVLSPMEKGI